MDTRKGSSRRGFLKTVGLGGAVLAATLWLPRRARANPATGAVKRVLIVNAPGGVRWNATFDGQTDVNHNPWGILNDPQGKKWSSGAASGQANGAVAPSWGVSRMLLQRPQFMNSKNWSSIYSYLSSDDPAHYNFNRPTVGAVWKNAGPVNQISSLIDLAASIAVVRVTSDPGGVFDSDHASATHTLVTGLRSGKVGLVTAFQHALKQQLGGSFAQQYPLPAVSVGNAGFALGVDEFASSRPIFLAAPYALPTTDPGNTVSSWGRQLESDYDASYAAARQAHAGQTVADYVNDKANGDAHVKQLIRPELHLSTAPGTAALGTLTDGKTPVTNAMLAEVFGLSSMVTPVGDPFIDCFASYQSNPNPTWASGQNSFGSNAALAVRLLQMGSPVVSLSVGSYDSHSNEVVDPTGIRTHSVQGPLLARTLTGLEFALQRIADPMDPTVSLWDSTVIVVCSEFGRSVIGASSDGFNAPNGTNLGGSDHAAWSAWPMLGGPVTAGGQLLVDATADPKANPLGFFQQNRVFTSALAGLGVTGASSAYLDFGKFAPLAGTNLIKGV